MERVLVQNIRQGVSNQLVSALDSVSRWSVVCAALPHVTFCCSSVLETRSPEQPLSIPAVKLFYTLHWLLLDASGECAETAAASTASNASDGFPIASLENFVYLLAPLLGQMAASDFENTIRLEHGLRLWKSLWEFR